MSRSSGSSRTASRLPGTGLNKYRLARKLTMKSRYISEDRSSVLQSNVSTKIPRTWIYAGTSKYDQLVYGPSTAEPPVTNQSKDTCNTHVYTHVHTHTRSRTARKDSRVNSLVSARGSLAPPRSLDAERSSRGRDQAGSPLRATMVLTMVNEEKKINQEKITKWLIEGEVN